jgi:uncharacterized repeat protein (TIGR03803 family)
VPKPISRGLLFASLLALVCEVPSEASGPPVYKLLYSPAFLATPGGYPATIFEGEPGLFYVLSTRGTNQFGASIFTVTSTGTFNLIHSFAPYVQSHALVQGANGLLYGAGFDSPNFHNFYFSLQASGKNVEQYSLPGQWGSGWQMIVAPPGEIYDIVAENPPGGAKVFGLARIAEDGKVAILHPFSANDCAPTGANLVYGRDGAIYGIGTQQLPGVSPGLIFRYTPRALSRLLSFPSFPYGGRLPLMAASDGDLYGLFGAGGANNTGELYRATLSGQFQTLASFPAEQAVQPQTLMQASDGNLYGTTNNTYVFRYDLKTRTLTSVYRLSPGGAQGLCPCELIQGMDGKLYGVAPFGGNYPGIGAVFSLDVGLPKPLPVISQVYPTAGPVGQKMLLWGKYLLGAKSVSFNGAPAANFSVTSGRSVHATVPPGATTGPVTITTANGSFKTSQVFTVQ